MNILDYTVAKAAREALNLSQATVATDVDLSRPDLSKYENGKLILSDDDQERLRDYYIELGGLEHLTEADLLQSDSQPQASDYRIRDGFVVANHIEEDNVELLLEELHWNEREIDRLGAVPLTKHIRKDEDSANTLGRLHCLTRRQYAIIQALQGKVGIEAEAFANDTDNLHTAGQLVDAMAESYLSTADEESPERLAFPLFSQTVPDKDEEESGGLFGFIAATGAIAGAVGLALLSSR